MGPDAAEDAASHISWAIHRHPKDVPLYAVIMLYAPLRTTIVANADRAT